MMGNYGVLFVIMAVIGVAWGYAVRARRRRALTDPPNSRKAVSVRDPLDEALRQDPSSYPRTPDELSTQRRRAQAAKERP